MPQDVLPGRLQHKTRRAQSGASLMHLNLLIAMHAPKAAHQTFLQAPLLCATIAPPATQTYKVLF